METTKKKFRIAKKGYDCFEVDQELLKYEQQLQDINEKLQAYQRQMEQTHEALAQSQQQYQELQSQLAVKEKAADQMSRIALMEANRVVETAHENADIIVREALSTARLVLAELSKVNQETTQLKTEASEKITTILQLIKTLELPQTPVLEWFEATKETQE